MKNDYIDLTEAAKRSPGRPHVASIWRWCRKGVASRSGGRIHLHHVRAGGRIFTTEDDLTAFFDRVAQADCEHFRREDATSVASKPSTSQRARSVQRAESVLREGGIL